MKYAHEERRRFRPIIDEQEYNNVYIIPANYTDAGKLFGGLLEVRNTVEAAILVVLLGYPELMWLHIPGTTKAVLMVVTLLPLGIAALMGVGGDSLGQRLYHICRYWRNRRRLHMRRVGYRHADTDTQKK